MSLITQDEINLLNTDSKFKNYVSSIEKTLKNFESSTEWADLISSLGKLKKVLQSAPKYEFIPKRISVCKRLAQCLHPALPSGVHLKALEVYTVLFQNIGTQNLSRDLFLYSSGLFPLLANAALSVKPILLGLYETYFLPLKKALRPCLTGLIIGILPGLEEGSDFYGRTFALLKNICIAQADIRKESTLSSLDTVSISSVGTVADDKYFYTCLWSAIVSQSSIRFPALQFILANYESKKKTSLIPSSSSSNKLSNILSQSVEDLEDQLYLIGNSIDLMINGICSCLQDPNPLVQRTILDLICLCLPLNSRQITKGDKLQLLVVAIHVVLRRDMTLNRRVYSWLIGVNSLSNSISETGQNETNSSPKNEHSTQINQENTLPNNLNTSENYFIQHSKSLLVSAIKILLNKKESSAILYLLNDDVSGSNNLQRSSVSANTSSKYATANSSLQNSTSASTSKTLKILKIVSNLVERQEIGNSIVDEILLDLLFYVFKECNSLTVHGGFNSMNYFKRTQSSQASGNYNLQQQNLKDLNDLKKATCNFLFQSFQMFFIWDFCAKKFEISCKNTAIHHQTKISQENLNSNQSESFPSPGHLCDLYEFILDLLTNAEIFNEIQTEHLPLMLKRIIQTLNLYCPNLSNQDLSKSLFLCLKILKKVIPKIAVPDTKQSKTDQSETSKNLSNPLTKIDSNTVDVDSTISKPTENVVEVLEKEKFVGGEEKPDKSIISEVLNEIITIIETKENQIDLAPPVQALLNETLSPLKKSSKIVLKTLEEKSNEITVENCIFHLKELTHTFIKSHLFKIEFNDENENANNSSEEIINKSFSSLFYSNQVKSFLNLNDDGYLIDDFDEYFKQKIHGKTTDEDQTNNQLEETITFLQDLIVNEKNSSNDSALNVYSIDLKHDCLNYLQSFQILNRLLIKMFFFPREQKMAASQENDSDDEDSNGESDQENESSYTTSKMKLIKIKLNEINRLIKSIENWLKDMFVISCASKFNYNNNSSQSASKLFEFQSISLNTIFELLNLSESVNSHFDPKQLIESSYTTSSNASKTTSHINKNKLNSIYRNLYEKNSLLFEFLINGHNSFSMNSNESSKNICLIQTIFSRKQIDFIYNKSQFGMLTANMLWSHLSNTSGNINESNFAIGYNVSSNSTTDKRAAILFCLLHEILPNNLCEDIIAHHLTNNFSCYSFLALKHFQSIQDERDCQIVQIDAIRRFTRLWHWSREMNLLDMTKLVNNSEEVGIFDDMYDINTSFSLSSNTIGKSKKTFERSILIILELLGNKMTPAPLAKQIQEWLLSCICDYNDLSRIIDILLVSLLHPNTARVSIQYYLNNIILASSANLLSVLPFSQVEDDEQSNASNYESKVYAISNEGGNVKYHVNNSNTVSTSVSNQQQTFLLTTLGDQSSLPSSSNSNNTNNTTKPYRNPNMELPLSILNAASLSSHGQGINLRINPFLATTAGNNNSTGNANNTISNSLSNIRNKLDYEDEFDQLDSAKNARLLENYKAIKAGQLKEKENQNKSNPLRKLSPSQPSFASKSTSAENLNTNSNEAPKIVINEQHHQDIESYNQTVLFQNMNVSDNSDDSDEDENDSENDEEEFDDDDDDDEQNYENYITHNELRYNITNDDTTDSMSRATDITILNNNNSSIEDNHNLNDESPLSVKKIKKTKADSKEKTKKIEKKTKKESSTSLNNKSKEYKNESINLTDGNLVAKVKNVKILNVERRDNEKNKKDSNIFKKSGFDINLKPATAQVITQKLVKNSGKEINVDARNPIDLNYAYMLIYVNCNSMQANFKHTRLGNSNTENKLSISSSTSTSYDHTRTLFIFKCIEQILDKCNKEFLISIICTSLNPNYKSQIPSNTAATTNSTDFNYSNGINSNNTPYSVHNEKLLELIYRHLKSIYGSSFYSNLSSSQNITIDVNRPTTYIEGIIMVLLFYIRSYYPPTSFNLTGAFKDDKLPEQGHFIPNQIKAQTLDSASRHKLSIQSAITKSASASSLHSAVNVPSSSSSNSSKSSNSSTLSYSPDTSVKFHLNDDDEYTQSHNLNNKHSLSDEKLIGERLAKAHSIDHDEQLFIDNRNVQINSLQILSKIIKELTSLCQSSNFVSNRTSNLTLANCSQAIIDLLERSKLQKTLLHCFYSTILNPIQNSLTFCILNTNTSRLTNQNLNFKKQIQYTYVVELMNTLENLIELEHLLNDYLTINSIQKGNRNNGPSSALANDQVEDDLLITPSKKAPLQININNKFFSSKTTNPLINQALNTTMTSLQSTRYIPSYQICNQSMFIASILHYLKHMNLVDYHLAVLKLLKNSLPSCGDALKSISMCVPEQLCRNLYYVTNGGNNSGSSSGANVMLPIITHMASMSASINIPDLVISIIKHLSYLLHYCLLNSNMSSLNGLTSEVNSIFSENQAKLYKKFQIENERNQSKAKEHLLSLQSMSSIVSSMAQVWQRCNFLLNSNGSNGPAVLFEASNSQQQQQQHQHTYTWILGHPITIQKCITDMLNPIAQHHSIQFITAIGNVWGEKRKKSKLNQEHKVIIELVRSLKSFPLSVIVQNVTEVLKQQNNNGKEKKKSPLNVWLLHFLHSYLEYYFSMVIAKPKSNETQNVTHDLAACLCNFFKESLSSAATSNFTPACYFQLFKILHDAVNDFPLLVEDKKYCKDIQDATHKLFELCNSIVASSLQQTTWLRKNYAVKLMPASSSASVNTLVSSTNTSAASTPTSLANSNYNSGSVVTVGGGPSAGGAMILQNDNASLNSVKTNANSSGYGGSSNLTNSMNSSMASSNVNGSHPIKSSNNNQLGDHKFNANNSSFSDVENEINSNLSDAGVSNLNCIDQLNINGELNEANNNLACSLQALNILAEYLAKTLDIVYKSDEKDRLVVPLLLSLMSNLWPYLKTHSVANKSNFRAASQLLNSLTVYPYTRKTWKKEVFEMLFDSMFFQVDSVTLEYSRMIIDNLISNDRTMFKDVLTRVTYQQSGGLFTSKEQESEQKAQLLKRLAFVIYSSEKDQYQKNMPEIQECIAHVLKLVQSSNLYSTLFLLFRILLLRISSRHLIALWPTMLTELIIILLQMEQDLNEDTETRANNKNNTSYLDHITSLNTTSQQTMNFKLPIYLSACKLIDLILTLPSSLTSQFQLYKWSFVNTDDALNILQRDQFVPYLTKINNLLKIKFPNVKTQYMPKSLIGGPLIRQKQLHSIIELKPFFETVTTHAFVHNSNQTQTISFNQSQNLLSSTNLKLFESAVHEDFLDGWIE